MQEYLREKPQKTNSYITTSLALRCYFSGIFWLQITETQLNWPSKNGNRWVVGMENIPGVLSVSLHSSAQFSSVSTSVPSSLSLYGGRDGQLQIWPFISPANHALPHQLQWQVSRGCRSQLCGALSLHLPFQSRSHQPRLHHRA